MNASDYISITLCYIFCLIRTRLNLVRILTILISRYYSGTSWKNLLGRIPEGKKKRMFM